MKLKDLYLSLLKEGKKYHILEIDIRYLLVFHQGYLNNNDFYLKLDDEVKNIEVIKRDFALLKKDYPLAYILKKTSFLGEEYFVNKNVLIPRVETEELVNLAISNIQKYFKNKTIDILDVGVGSGVISISLKKKIKCNVFATDISKKALNVANKNAIKHNANINFFHSNVFPKISQKYDVIISNPPYIKHRKNATKSVKKFEPHIALFLRRYNNVYKKIFKQISKYKKDFMLMMFEVSGDLESILSKMIQKYLCKYSNVTFEFKKDINKNVRFLIIIINKDDNIK